MKDPRNEDEDEDDDKRVLRYIQERPGSRYSDIQGALFVGGLALHRRADRSLQRLRRKGLIVYCSSAGTCVLGWYLTK